MTAKGLWEMVTRICLLGVDSINLNTIGDIYMKLQLILQVQRKFDTLNFILRISGGIAQLRLVALVR